MSFWEIKDDSPIDEEALDRVKTLVRQNDNYLLEAAETRNILMVGRTRSGKTTAVGVLKDTAYEPPMMTLFSETSMAKLDSFSLLVKDKNQKLNLNMIDTPGLFEIKESKEKARSEQQILSIIKDCMKMEIAKIHCVTIFASFETGVNSQDLEAARLLKQLFSGTTILFCITRAENKTDSWKRSILSEISTMDEYKDIVENVVWMGCFNSKSSNISTDEDALLVYKKVYNMRRSFLEKIMECSEPTQIYEIPLVQTQRTGLKELLMTYAESLLKLSGVDLSTNTGQLALAEAAEIQEQIRPEVSNINGFGLHEEVMALVRVAGDLRQILPAKEFSKVCGILDF